MSDFKFDIKLKPKKIGEFDVGNPSIWTLLIKPQFKDDTLFVHLHCLFQEPLTDEQKANGVTEPHPVIEITKGFVKEGQFIPTDKKTVSAPEKIKITAKYQILMEALTEEGFIKHGEMYLGAKEPDTPVYHVFEKGGGGMFDMDKILQQMGSLSPGTIPVGTANNPPKNPHIMLKANKIAKVAIQPNNNTNNP